RSSTELALPTFSEVLDVSGCNTLLSPYCHAEGSEASSHIQACHSCQHLIHNSKILLRQTHRARRSQKLIADSYRRQWHIQFPTHLKRQQHIFLHHIHIKPHLIRRLKNEWRAILQRGRSNHTIKHHFHSSFARNPPLLGQK